jgi:hypothetical protein
MRRLVLSGALAISVLAGLGLSHHLTWWTPDPPRDQDALVLRIDFVEGMGSPNDRPIPAISLYGNGRLVTTATDLARMPARQIIRDQRLTYGAYDRIYRDARVAGLATSRTFRSDEQISDAGPTRITFLAAGGHQRSTIEPGAGGLRVQLIERLAKRLRAVPSDDLARPAASYSPARMALVVQRATADSEARIRPWPLRPLGETCTVLTGPEATTAERLATSAASLPHWRTHWRSGSTLYSVNFRPLLPDEKECPGR